MNPSIFSLSDYYKDFFKMFLHSDVPKILILFFYF